MPKRFNRPNRPTPPKRQPRDKKGSPDALRRVFTAIRNTAADGKPMSKPEFRAQLQKAWETPGNNYGVSKIGETYYRASEDGAHDHHPYHLEYWLMEAYARHSSIPLGVILLVSRLTARKRHIDDSENPTTPDPLTHDDIIKGIIAVCDFYMRELKDKEIIDNDDLKRCLDAFHRDNRKSNTAAKE